MHTVQTDADPPNQGRMILATSGCTWNSRNAERNTVVAYRRMFFADEFSIPALLSAYSLLEEVNAHVPHPLRGMHSHAGCVDDPRRTRARPGREGARHLSLSGPGPGAAADLGREEG